jgi:hypothetical protein
MFCVGGNNHLFSDDNPETTLKGLGYKDRKTAIHSIKKIEETFSRMRNEQKVNTYSPNNLRPRAFLDSKKAIERYYLKQKMYRILALLNRLKVTKKPNTEAMELFQKWMKEYRVQMDKLLGK